MKKEVEPIQTQYPVRIGGNAHDNDSGLYRLSLAALWFSWTVAFIALLSMIIKLMSL